MRRAVPAIVGLVVVSLFGPQTRSEYFRDSLGDDPPSKPTYSADVRPLLRTYCFECHNPTKRKAGLDLDEIDTDAAAAERGDLWDGVGERVRAKEMPPGKSKQPTEAERKVLLNWAAGLKAERAGWDKLTRAEKERASAAQPRSRRLNRTEYSNTLRDLFGVDLRPGDLLPSEGGGGEGFDNAGATLFTTPTLMEKYLEAADVVLGTIFPATETEQARSEKAIPAGTLPVVQERILVATPGDRLKPADAAHKALESFLPRAFRRPATDKELDRYQKVFDTAHTRGDSFEQAVRLTLKAVLISSSFLFLVETPAEKPGVYSLNQYETASHLSYFLWASMPDPTLFDVAAKGKLDDAQVLKDQVRRMLRDPKSRGLADGFAAQWLGIRPLGTTIRPDARTFPEFDEELAAAMRAETVLFFDAIVRDDRSVLDLISADYTFVNERLAKHYKIDGVKGPEMRRVTLTDPARGGVLGHAGILTVTSYPHRTSPVLRGRWVLEELLGTDVPPPPADVPVLNERQKSDTVQTLRQLLEKHRSKAECASCHGRMDPLGFGLENFDPLGRWRTQVNGQPIDTAGVLPSGEQFNGPAELKKVLLETRRTEFLRNLSRKAIGYAFGREVRRTDKLVVEDCVNALENGEFRSSRLFETVVLSYAFTHRTQPQ
jgi:mono/diheme cytochrome c family protein